MADASSFYESLQMEMRAFLELQEKKFPSHDRLRIDLHCHDFNSNRPEEVLGRMLRLPETWLPTEILVSVLKTRRCDVLTITNHNTARSCYMLQDKGVDVLVAAEFSCTLPDFRVGVHVLTFGFTPAQETRLNELRKDLYRFQEYCAQENIPTVLAHPLHYYSPSGMPPAALMDRFALLFERFEGINAQRDTRGNLLTVRWVESLDVEALDAISRRSGIPVDAFCRQPFRKRITGGSDCHMGIFTGTAGTLLHVPGLKNRGEPRSQLALEALREGRLVPFSCGEGEQKLALAFLDYFCQAVHCMEDPGLLGIFLHPGNAKQKGLAMGIGNALFELRQRPNIMRFTKILHASLLGRSPSLLTRILAPPPYRPLLQELERVAKARSGEASAYNDRLERLIPFLYKEISRIFCRQLVRNLKSADGWKEVQSSDLISLLEQPSRLRVFFGARRPAVKTRSAQAAKKSLDGLTFPFLGVAALAGASFAGAKILSEQKDFAEELATRLRFPKCPPRALWLTDTYGDRNGVSHALGSVLKEVQKKDLPIDFLICSGSIKPEPHLFVLPPVAEFNLPVYRDQNLRIPDLMEMQSLFRKGGFDRLMCSTEGPMGLAGLYLKHAFRVPAFSYLHTDWLGFAKRSLNWNDAQLKRLQLILRLYYQAFDGVFVLNTEQKEWLASPEMSIPAEKIFPTAHWAESHFRPVDGARKRFHPELGGKPALLYVGRLSEEKGVLELPAIFRSIRSKVPDVEMLVAGTGPSEERLRKEFPEAHYLGWLSDEELPGLYSAADVLLLPSRFDTFGCVILEAFSCGLPVIAYDTKGPRDLIENGKSGFLARNLSDFVDGILQLVNDPDHLEYARAQALRRSKDFRCEDILNQLVFDLGLGTRNGKSQPDYSKADSKSGNLFDSLLNAFEGLPVG